jgi:nitrogen regulatory protein P-II 1
MIMAVVDNDQVEEVVDVISKTTKTGEIGDGKIFVSPVENAFRIRTGEKGDKAL